MSKKRKKRLYYQVKREGKKEMEIVNPYESGRYVLFSLFIGFIFAKEGCICMYVFAKRLLKPSYFK